MLGNVVFVFVDFCFIWTFVSSCSFGHFLRLFVWVLFACSLVCFLSCLILFCFELFKHFSKKKFNFNSSYRSSAASKSQVNNFLSFIIKGLDKKGFLQPEHKRKSMIRNIYNIFHRLNLSEQEIRILLGIFTTLNGLNKKS